MTRSRTRVAGLVLAAITALVLAAGTGATAATLITGARVKDGSLTGVDIKNGSVGAIDLAQRYLKSNQRVVVKSSRLFDTPAPLTGTITQVRAVTVKAPVAGTVVLSASAEFNAKQAGGYITTEIYRNGTRVTYQDWDPGDVDGNYDQTQSYTIAVPVKAGDHTFSFRLGEFEVATFSQMVNPTLVATFVPS
jgi:hypothetical protein